MMIHPASRSSRKWPRLRCLFRASRNLTLMTRLPLHKTLSFYASAQYLKPVGLTSMQGAASILACISAFTEGHEKAAFSSYVYVIVSVSV